MDELAFLAAIRAYPDDDAYRLVYADWLDEQGQAERAEFIRLECEEDRTIVDDSKYGIPLRPSSRLSDAHRERWFGPLADARLFRHMVTRRGFVDSVELAANHLPAHAEDLANYAPLLRELCVAEGGRWREFFAVPWLASLTALTFASNVATDETIVQLTQSRYTENLVELGFAQQQLTEADMSVFASVDWPDLECLNLSENGLRDDAFAVLVLNEHFPNIRVLDLSMNELTDDACRALGAAEGFGQLEVLSFIDNLIGSDGVAALASAPHLEGLRELDLSQNRIGPDGGRALLASRTLERLQLLHVSRCGMGAAVVEELRWVFGSKNVIV